MAKIAFNNWLAIKREHAEYLITCEYIPLRYRLGLVVGKLIADNTSNQQTMSAKISVKTFMKQTKSPRRSVYHAIKQLKDEDGGLIKIESVGGGRGKASTYKLMLENAQNEAERVQ